MGSESRRQWTPEEKLQILEEARKAGQAVSEVCRRHQIAPGQFYRWEQQARKGALQALRNGKRGRKPSKTEDHLKTEVTRLRTVVAELVSAALSRSPLVRLLARAPSCAPLQDPHRTRGPRRP